MRLRMAAEEKTKGLLEQLRRADQLAEEGHNQEALQVLEELERLSSHPQDLATLKLKKAIVLTNMGDIANAEQLILTLDVEVLSDEYRLSSKFEAGRIAAAKGEVNNAIMILTQAIREADQKAVVGDLAEIRNGMILLLGKLLYEVGQSERAIPILQRISDGTPGWQEAAITLGDCYVQVGKYREAIKCYHHILDKRRGISELDLDMATRNLGAAYFFSGQYSKAIEHLRRVADKFNDFPDLRREIDELMVVASSHLRK